MSIYIQQVDPCCPYSHALHCVQRLFSTNNFSKNGVFFYVQEEGWSGCRKRKPIYKSKLLRWGEVLRKYRKTKFIINVDTPATLISSLTASSTFKRSWNHRLRSVAKYFNDTACRRWCISRKGRFPRKACDEYKRPHQPSEPTNSISKTSSRLLIRSCSS